MPKEILSLEDLIEQILKEVNLDDDGFKRLIKNKEEFKECVIGAIREFSVNNRFAKEEVGTDFFGYLSDYEPNSIAAQVETLRKFFPGIQGNVDEKITKHSLPANAEGLFAILRWQSVAETYVEAVEKVLKLIKKKRKDHFYNSYEDKLRAKFLRRRESTIEKFEALADQQKGYDVLVVAAQFGLRHRGRSTRRAREIFTIDEFELGVFEIGCMLLAHPERLRQFGDLGIICSGDEYAPAADGNFSEVPCLQINDTKRVLVFDMNRVDRPYEGLGTPSAFLSY